MKDFLNEKIVISIDPATLEYELDITYARISNIRAVCADIVERIDKNEFTANSGLNVVELDDDKT
jgi:hypothetical protein